MTFCMKKSFDNHQTITKKGGNEKKGENLVGITSKKSCLYRILHRFYGSNTNGCLETRGVEPLTSTLPALRSTS